jgi:dTDP-4-dehydrorhamnose 3,5-epimerase
MRSTLSVGCERPPRSVGDDASAVDANVRGIYAHQMQSPVTAAGIVGGSHLVAKQSAVDAEGLLRQTLIDGVRFRPVRPVPHEDGTVAEIARAAWPEIDLEIVQVHLTTTYAGRVRAWGLHQRSTDRLFVVKGLVSIVVFDGRESSPTFGSLNEFRVTERNPGLLVIPPNLYHGWKNIGIDEAFIINMPSSQYAHAGPDALDLPYESPLAEEIVPFRW